MTVFPIALVLLGGVLAVVAWARTDGLPRLSLDRWIEQRGGPSPCRAIDLVLSLAIVAAGVAAAA